MNDLISRQWLMECIDEGWIQFDTKKDANTYIHLIRDIAPSSLPKTGKWIKPTGMMPPEYTGTYRCSECGEIAMRDWKELHHQTLTKFCPNCGASMKEGD